MNKGKIFDLLFIILAFGIYIIILNIDQQTDRSNIICRHIWLPLIIAYFTGRYVSVINGKNRT